jgi:hypothetical protein
MSLSMQVVPPSLNLYGKTRAEFRQMAFNKPNNIDQPPPSILWYVHTLSTPKFRTLMTFCLSIVELNSPLLLQ